MNPFANHISDRADRAWFIIWLVVFIASGTFITWFGAIHWTNDHVAATGTYVTEITPTSPCAMSMRQVRLNRGQEDDLCAAWIGPRGRVHVGPLSDAPANAHMVGE